MRRRPNPSLLAVLMAATALWACPVRYKALMAQPSDRFPVAWDGTSAAGRSAPAPTAAPAPAPPPPAASKGRTRPPSGKMLAVLTFKADRSAKLGGNQVVMLTDFVRQLAFRHAGHMGIMTRENIDVLLQAHGTTLEKCSEAQCEVEFGQKIGADVVVSGSISKLGTYLFLHLRAHDTSAGRLVGAETVKAKDIDALVEALEEAATKIFAGL